VSTRCCSYTNPPVMRTHSITHGIGMLASALATCLLGLVTTILFLFCTPDLDTLFSLKAPQPFVLIYSLSVGRQGSIVLTILAVIGPIMVGFSYILRLLTSGVYQGLQDASICIVSSSHLLFAVARDGMLPRLKWMAQVSSSRQPINTINASYFLVAAILCTMLPSQVAFFSILSSCTLLLIASYGLISLLRLTMTPNKFKSFYFYLSRFRKLFYLSSVLWNTFLVAVSDCSNWRMSDGLYVYSGLNFAIIFPCHCRNLQFCKFSDELIQTDVSVLPTGCVIFLGVTILAILSWYFIPAERWVFCKQTIQVLHAMDERN